MSSSQQINPMMMFFRYYACCLLPCFFLILVAFDLLALVILPALLLFMGVPILDPLIGEDRKNIAPEQLTPRVTYLLELAPVVYSILYISSIIAGSWYVSVTQDWIVLLACVLTVGTIGGVAFSATHELIHKKDRWSKYWGRAGLLAVAFLHFEIEHLRSHHRYACTENDTSTARFGESIYAFLWRAIPAGILFSWRFECDRLTRIGLPALHLRNRVIWYAAAPIFVALVFFLVFGWRGMVLYVAQAILGFLVLMIAAYIEHYGVLRNINADGKLERMGVRHSWDSYYLLSGCLTFNVQRHSDHHLNATKSYPLLEHHDSAMELPAGYQAMIALSLIPPLWRRVMDPLLPIEMRNRALDPN